MKAIAAFQTLWNFRASRCERSTLLILLLVCATTVFSTAVVQSLVVALTLAVVVCLFRKRPLTFTRTPLDLPFATFVAARIISIAFSQDRAVSLPALYIEYFYYMVFFLVTQTLDGDVASGSCTTVFVLTASAVVAAAVGITKVFLSFSPVASSTTAGTYTLGAYLCAVLPLLLIARPSHETARLKNMSLLSAAIICLGITLTLDRLHWAGMALTLLVAGLFFQRRVLFLSLGGAAAVVLAFPQVLARFDTILHLGHNMAGHDIIWRGALKLIDQHPIIGFGPRTFQQIFPLFREMWVPGVSSWHNDYLQVYMESGLIGLFPLLWVVGSVYYQAWRSLRSQTLPPEERYFLIALVLSMTVVFLIGGMLDTLVGITFRVLLALFALLVSRSRPALQTLEAGRENKAAITTPAFALPEAASRTRHVS